MTEKANFSNRRRRWILSVTSALAMLSMILVTAIALLPTKTAEAHGAMTYPGSRTYLCYLDAIGPNGPRPASNPACADAVAQGGYQPLYDWFAVLISNAAGRHREVVPDGQLCGAGTTKYAAYNMARDDWPSTTLRAGSTITWTYNAWAPHPGTFDLYITKDGFNVNAGPLKWSDLEPVPFLSVTNPPIVNGEYTWTGALPNKTGRHIIYSTWTRSDSPEAFYNCTDVVLTNGGTNPTPTPTATATRTPTPVVTPTPGTTPTPGVTPTPGNGGSCSVTYSVNQWPNGFTANITVKNNSSSPINGWNLKWTWGANQSVTNGWNAVITQSGSQVTATNQSYNSTIPANGSTTFGFNASWNGSNPTPTNFTLNNTACSVS